MSYLTYRSICAFIILYISSTANAQSQCEKHLNDFRNENIEWSDKYINAKDSDSRELASDIRKNLNNMLSELRDVGKEILSIDNYNIDGSLLTLKENVKFAEKSGGFAELPRSNYHLCMANLRKNQLLSEANNLNTTRDGLSRTDQERQGKRKTHDPAAEANECIFIDKAGSGNFGAFKNQCPYPVNFTTCNEKPRVIQGGFNWSADFDCTKQQFGLHTPKANSSVAAHNRNTEFVYWFACKAPAMPVDATYAAGKGIEARCH